jgi:hypothetical protein
MLLRLFNVWAQLAFSRDWRAEDPGGGDSFGQTFSSTAPIILVANC